MDMARPHVSPARGFQVFLACPKTAVAGLPARAWLAGSLHTAKQQCQLPLKPAGTASLCKAMLRPTQIREGTHPVARARGACRVAATEDGEFCGRTGKGRSVITGIDMQPFGCI